MSNPSKIEYVRQCDSQGNAPDIGQLTNELENTTDMHETGRPTEVSTSADDLEVNLHGALKLCKIVTQLF